MSEPMRSLIPAARTASGISYCSFGELLQGVLLEDDADFLVTLPIQKYSVSTFVPDPGSTEIVTQPSGKTKAAALAKVILGRYGHNVGGTFYIDCDIPIGKGLSSSSADLLATARAIEVYMGRELPLGELCRDMSGIEPTDGVMFAESVVYLQRKGVLWSRLGRLSGIQILSLDEGGTIDTLEYHRRARIGTTPSIAASSTNCSSGSSRRSARAISTRSAGCRPAARTSTRRSIRSAIWPRFTTYARRRGGSGS